MEIAISPTALRHPGDDALNMTRLALNLRGYINGVESVAQPGCSSQELRRPRRAAGGRCSLPTAAHGEVRVRVLASGLEHTDILIRRHLYPQTMRHRPPFVMGYDVVGEIDQLGDGVTGFDLGDRVADMTVIGSNAAYRTLWAAA